MFQIHGGRFCSTEAFLMDYSVSISDFRIRILVIIGECSCWILSKNHERGKVVADCKKGGPYRGHCGDNGDRVWKALFSLEV